MTDNTQDNLQNSRWKRKYFEHLEKTDAVERALRERAQLIADGLGALCNFSGLMSGRASKACQPVRHAIHKNVFSERLPEQLAALKQALSDIANEMQELRERTVTALRQSVERLQEICESPSTLGALRKLKKALKARHIDDEALISHLLEFGDIGRGLIENAWADHAAPAADGDIATPAPPKKGADAGPPLQHDSSIVLLPNARTTPQAAQLAATLLYLLGQLDIPQALQDDAQLLRTRLQQEGDWQQLELLLMPTIELTLSTVAWHNSHFSEFLEQINSQLDAIQNFLAATQTSRELRQANHRELNDSMCRTVGEIEQTVAASDDLGQLKADVSRKMGQIVEALASFEESEKQRESVLIGELESLGGKLREMETKSQRMRAKLESQKQLARRDTVTGLPNRAAYEERLQFEFARFRRYGAPFCLLLGDIDHFKQINDHYGHLAGDKVLKMVGQTLAKSLRETDFVARYGGEEFAILLPNATLPDAKQVAEKLRQKVAECPFHRRRQEVDVTISFGISELSAGDSLEMIFERADSALYKAKEMGRNRCYAAEVVAQQS